ncbi:hypothetical protein BS78_07G198100 [Paspalum vaginatum]|nr:hypothetical protein BS78_07G198100 [Paspalum vaginatum]
MAASAGTGSKQLQLRRRRRRCVASCRLPLLLVVLLVVGDVVVADRACSPPTEAAVLHHQAQRQQGLLRRSGDGSPTTTTTAGDGWPAAAFNENERQTAGAGRRMLIGSRAPTCTYNECRGCRHRCSVQEVPVDASDPINSAYHYKCICHI